MAPAPWPVPKAASQSVRDVWIIHSVRAHLLAQQMTPAELWSMRDSALDFAADSVRDAERTIEAMRCSSMTPEAEEFWLGETRAVKLARFWRHADACRAAAEAAQRALVLIGAPKRVDVSE